jgi:hypothetical protein
MMVISILPPGVVNVPLQTNAARPQSQIAGPGEVDASRIERVPAKLEPFVMTELSGPLAPIMESGGLIFQYTPSITESIEVRHESSGDLVHSNEQYYVYKATENRKISLSNITFTADTVKNARYLLAAIHFFRVFSLMDFGAGKTGRPPSPMWFSAYGRMLFDRVPVLMSGATITFPADRDYVKVSLNEAGIIPSNVSSDLILGNIGQSTLAGGALGDTLVDAIRPSTSGSDSVWIPAKLDIDGITLTVQHAPKFWKNQFSLDDYRRGGAVEQRETQPPAMSSSPIPPASSTTPFDRANSSSQVLPRISANEITLAAAKAITGG